MDLLKRHYMSVFSVVYSSCGNYLAAGNNCGKIAIFNLTPYLESDDQIQLDENHSHPIFTFSAHNSPIYSLVSTKKLIISGSVGEICAWKWNDVRRKESKPLWSLTIPQGDNLTKPEVNSLVIGSKENESLLYAGCGDSKVYCFNIETCKLNFVLQGHADYIHCVAVGNSGHECISGSEDGSVKVWDSRKGGKEIHSIEPFKHQGLYRPQFGKWIGCVAFDESDDWLVCGGGPVLSIWHLRSLSPSTQFLKADATSTVAHFYDDTVISGGSEPCINHWSLDGKLITEVPTSASSIYSIGIISSPTQQVLTAAGTSYRIDVCTDFRFKDFSLSFL